MSATRTSPRSAPLIEFLDLFATQCSFVREVSNKCHNRVIVLDLPVDALVYEFVACVSQCLALIPVPDMEPNHIRVVGQNPVCNLVKIMLALPFNPSIDLPYFRVQSSPLLGTTIPLVTPGFKLVNQDVVFKIQLPQRVDVIFMNSSICFDAS